MDIQSEKLQLIQWLTQLNDAQLIKKLVAFKANVQKDWWDEISEEERNEIREGLAQADRGELKSHKQVMAKYKKWL